MTHNLQPSQETVAGLDPHTIDSYRQLVSSLTSLGSAAIQDNETLQQELAHYAQLLTDALRWEGQHAEAIQVQEELMSYLPEDAAQLSVMAATLKIEAGRALEGFATLRAIAEQDPENVWGWITLGSNQLWIGEFAEAEANLLRAAQLESADASDRAVARQYLFKLYGLQRRVDEAVASWDQACRLDPSLAATLPDLLRMLIYWYHYDTAERYLLREHDPVRHRFYEDLINMKRSPVYPRSTWQWVHEVDLSTVELAQEEFAEACLRFVQPQLALAVLEPALAQGEHSRRRLAFMGLAWAQQRMIERAKWALNLAIRAGELERPRGTRRSVGGKRVLDSETRILYGEIVVDPDIRKEIDAYFMPVVNSD